MSIKKEGALIDRMFRKIVSPKGLFELGEEIMIESFIRERTETLFRLECDLAFMKEQYGELLECESDIRKQLIELQNKEFKYKKKNKFDQLRNISPELIKLDEKIKVIDEVKSKTKQFEKTGKELRSYIKHLRVWRKEGRKFL